jgi:hypothetical protein
MSEAMRKLAEQLRHEVTRREAVKREKCAQIVVAANGLTLLRRKLGGRNA